MRNLQLWSNSRSTGFPPINSIRTRGMWKTCPLFTCAARRSFFQPSFYLALDLLRVGWIGLERQRLLPGFARLVLASRPLVRIAEMVSCFAVLWFERCRALDELDRLRIVAEAIVRPAETVEQIAVVRFELYGLLERARPSFSLRFRSTQLKPRLLRTEG